MQSKKQYKISDVIYLTQELKGQVEEWRKELRSQRACIIEASTQMEPQVISVLSTNDQDTRIDCSDFEQQVLSTVAEVLPQGNDQQKGITDRNNLSSAKTQDKGMP